MSVRAANWMAIALLAFSAFSILALFPPPNPDYDLIELAETVARNDAKGSKPTESATSQYYEEFMAERKALRLESALFFFANLAAALVTFWRREVGVWFVLLVCAYVLYFSAPPFFRMAIDAGFINFTSIVFSTTMRVHGVPTGLMLSWNIVVAPFAYALLASAAVYFLCLARLRRTRESN